MSSIPRPGYLNPADRDPEVVPGVVIPRDQVVRRQARQCAEQVTAAVGRVNEVLGAAAALPVYVSDGLLGGRSEVVNEVLRRLKEAGYVVTLKRDNDGSARYEVG